MDEPAAVDRSFDMGWVSDFTYVATWAGFIHVSIKYTERLAEAGIEPSVGSVGDSSDNALAETINGLRRTRRGSNLGWSKS